MCDHVSASGSTELSDSVDLSMSESEEESSLPSTSDSNKKLCTSDLELFCKS